MKLLFFILSSFIVLSMAQAEPGSSEDYDRQNERIGLDTAPTATRVKDVEMILGAIYSGDERISLSTGAEELVNRNGVIDNPKKSDRSQRSSN